MAVVGLPFSTLRAESLTDGMVLIPAGSFEMGDHHGFVDPKHGGDEVPLHTVRLDSFRMAVHDVTTREYCGFLNDCMASRKVEVRAGGVYLTGKCDLLCDTRGSSPSSEIGWDGSRFSVLDKKEDHPMVCVRWHGAAAYCNWLSVKRGLPVCYNAVTWDCDFNKSGFRLPTEAEWEYAARGGRKDPYCRFPWGDDADPKKANVPESDHPFRAGQRPAAPPPAYRAAAGPPGQAWRTGALPQTTPVGFFNGKLQRKADFGWPGDQATYQTSDGANGYGLHDMCGNVWQWCTEWYERNYYAYAPAENPPGPAEGSPMPDGKPYRCMRGGSWFNGEFGHGRVSNRDPSYYRGPDPVTGLSDADGPWFHIGFRVVLPVDAGKRPPVKPTLVQRVTGRQGVNGAGRPPGRAGSTPVAPAGGLTETKPSGSFVLRSPAVGADGVLPKDFTGEGAAVTPPLEWSGAPAATKSYAVIMHHSDARGEHKSYWVLYDIPAEVRSVPRDVKGVGTVGVNTHGRRVGYEAPRSAGPGVRKYVFTVHALSVPPPLALPGGEVTDLVLLENIKDKIIASADLETNHTRDTATRVGRGQGDGVEAGQGPRQGENPGDERRASGGQGGRRPGGPLLAALDANGDGTIDAGELAKATEVLKKFDLDGDGRLSPGEYQPQRRGGGGGEGPGGDVTRSNSSGAAGLANQPGDARQPQRQPDVDGNPSAERPRRSGDQGTRGGQDAQGGPRRGGGGGDRRELPENKTPASPNAGQTVGLFLNTPKACPGFTLFAPKHNTVTYLINNDGQVVHSWDKSKYEPGQTVHLLPNGHMVRSCMLRVQGGTGGGEGGRIEEYDWEGNLVWEFDHATREYQLHHDIKPLPNGNFLALMVERKTREQALAAGFRESVMRDNELVTDAVVEIQPIRPKGGKIVWEWHVWDHLVQDTDRGKPDYGDPAQHPERIDVNCNGRPTAAFWNHMNSLDYNAKLDQIVLSVRGCNEVWIIDHSTTTQEAAGHSGGRSGKGGDLLYRWGNPAAYQRGTTGDKQLVQQHDALWIPDGYPGAGQMTIFNNGYDRGWSSVEEIVLPMDANGRYILESGKSYGPDKPVWHYEAKNRTDFFSAEISGAHRLPNGNTLVCAGIVGNLFEVTPAGEMVWQYVNPMVRGGILAQGELPGKDVRGHLWNAVFKVHRYEPGYPGLKGRDLTPKGVIELPAAQKGKTGLDQADAVPGERPPQAGERGPQGVGDKPRNRPPAGGPG